MECVWNYSSFSSTDGCIDIGDEQTILLRYDRSFLRPYHESVIIP